MYGCWFVVKGVDGFVLYDVWSLVDMRDLVVDGEMICSGKFEVVVWCVDDVVD